MSQAKESAGDVFDLAPTTGFLLPELNLELHLRKAEPVMGSDSNLVASSLLKARTQMRW